MEVLKYIVENWYVFVGLIALLAGAIVSVVYFLRKPTEEQIKSVKEWLKYAITMAEANLGSGTGALKLRQVYDKFATTFPKLVYFVSFEQFQKWVSEALPWLENQLNSNSAVQDLIIK